MRTTQKPTDLTGRLLAAVCLVATLTGCTPPEQNALEEGSRLLADGKIAEALKQLEDAQKRIEGHPNLKTNLVVVGKLYNQLGLSHQILSKNKTGDAKQGELSEAKKYFDLVIKKGGRESRIQAYQNLAWLHLEAKNWEEAAEAFGSLRMTNNNSKSTNNVFQYWLEKGTAELRAERTSDAIESFSNIPDNTHAQNGLGTVAWKQKDIASAAKHFKKAVDLDGNNPIALLNLAVVQQELKQYPEARETYRSYLAIVPDADSEIKQLVNSLEEYLKPEPEPEPVAEVEPEPKEEVKPEPTVAEVEPKETQPEPEPPNVVIVEPPTEEPEPEPAAPEPEIVTVNEPAPLPVPVAKPEPLVTQVEPAEPSEQTPEPEVGQVDTTAEPEPPKDWKRRLNPLNWFDGDNEKTTAEPEPAVTQVEPAKQSESAPEPEPPKDWKQRANPLNWFGGNNEKTTAEPNKKTKSQVSWRSRTATPTTPLPSPRLLAKASTNTVKVASVLPSAVAFPRYKYLSPTLPDNGDRQVAQAYFDDGATAQKTEEWQRAKAAYIEATKADPAWFDARFELGQAAFYTGDTNLALQSFEHALAIDPNDGPARFNFAMSLAQGNYYADAASEFETYLQFDPDNVQAHFEAGKLYAGKLNDVARASVHYKRMIGLQPGHPQAVTIRYWLIRNKAN